MALVFHRVVSVDEALRIIEEKTGGVRPLGVEKVSVEESLGRVLAENIVARVDSPPFDRSTVDGYAVRAEDTYNATEMEPVELRVVGACRVGEAPGGGIRRGECMEISTGAPIPPGADAVVMVEYTKRDGDRVWVYRGVGPGENISQTGSDITAGDMVLRSGRRISAIDLAVLSALGYREVKVYRRPRIAVFSTGDELVSPGTPLRMGQVYDVNGPTLTSILRDMGAEAWFGGILPDRFEEMRKAVLEALRSHDAVITSGSTSAGFGDMIYKVFNEVGGVLIHGLKLKPGKPTVIGVSDDGKLLVGLPGFPLSALMVFKTLVEPLIESMMGLRASKSVRAVKARMPFRIEGGRGKRRLLPVQLVESSKGLSAYPIAMDSGAASALMLADGFIDIPEQTQYLDEDEEVEVNLLGEYRVPSLTIIGSHCPGLDILTEIAGLHDAKIVNVGSLGGWRALKRGEADVAGTHLLNPQTHEYNTHMPEKMGLEGQVEIYRGYVRTIGLVVRPGNPKRIRGLEDLLRDDIVFVNRVKGSGIRTYLDHVLEDMGVKEPEKNIRGYTYEAKTHTAVAAAVAQGRADTGIAIGYAAHLYKLDFIPLTEEHYDIAVRKDRANKPSVRKLLQTLKSQPFKEKLNKLPYYKTDKETGAKIY